MPLLAAELFYRLGQRFYRPFWQRPRWVGAVLAALGIVALLGIAQGGVNDAVINLNTSPKALLASEQQVQQILQQPSVSQFFYLEADSPEQLLSRTQALGEQLAALHLPDLRWQGVQHYLPSAAQQLADRQLVADKLYGEQGALSLLCQTLGTQCQPPALSVKVLTPEALAASSLAELLPPMQRQGDGWRTLVTLSGSVQDADLAALAQRVEGVKLVNQTEDLSRLLGRYRASVSELLLVTLLLLAVGLALRYRHHSWRMLLPLLLAMAMALGCAAVDGITLFHVMALLLVIGIGLDTAVFYTEGGFNAESWLASSLACGTSIIAFGLLSLSVVPVLHQFGLIILVGILGCWLLTPLFFRPQPELQAATSANRSKITN
jgi:predicted exporter